MVAVSYKPFLFLLSILGETPEGRMAGKVKGRKVQGKIVTLAKRKEGGEDDSCRTDAPQLRCDLHRA
jgi:hypothetical protein